MTIDLNHLMQFLSFAFAIASAAFAWFSKKDGATAHQLREIEQKQQASDARLVQMETQLQSVPTKEAFHRLELSMQEVRGTVDQIKDHYKETKATLLRLEEFLIKPPARTQGRK
jgi:hypothetical protein